ncbi:MAG: hypothetical protein PHP51_02095 [Desulfotomaculaceae bacterium]|nr:hypothetical protein [Desulfotomaculaceae bacterium]MDD4766494.1 hypothetical protein [Desulfotomaculaceae bacterium]
MNKFACGEETVPPPQKMSTEKGDCPSNSEKSGPFTSNVVAAPPENIAAITVPVLE